MSNINLGDVERKINEILRGKCEEILSDSAQVRYFSSIFDRTSEEGFYTSVEGPAGKGEKPTWSPNEAYMQSAERMWEPVLEYIAVTELQTDKSLRDLFPETREYKDTETNHRRVFFGQLCNNQREPITAFMLTIAHSHEKFWYPEVPYVFISRKLA